MDDNTRAPLNGRVRLVEPLTDIETADVRLHIDNSAVGYPCSVVTAAQRHGRYNTVLDFITDAVFAGPRVPAEEVLDAKILNYGRHTAELRIKLVGGAVIVRPLPVFVVRGFNPEDDQDGDGNPDDEGNEPSPLDPTLLFENALL